MVAEPDTNEGEFTGETKTMIKKGKQPVTKTAAKKAVAKKVPAKKVAVKKVAKAAPKKAAAKAKGKNVAAITKKLAKAVAKKKSKDGTNAPVFPGDDVESVEGSDDDMDDLDDPDDEQLLNVPKKSYTPKLTELSSLGEGTSGVDYLLWEREARQWQAEYMEHYSERILGSCLLRAMGKTDKILIFSSTPVNMSVLFSDALQTLHDAKAPLLIQQKDEALAEYESIKRGKTELRTWLNTYKVVRSKAIIHGIVANDAVDGMVLLQKAEVPQHVRVQIMTDLSKGGSDQGESENLKVSYDKMHTMLMMHAKAAAMSHENGKVAMFGGETAGSNTVLFGNDTRREGDWTCPNCKFNCFGRRSKCVKCGASKPGGGSGSGGGGGGPKRGKGGGKGGKGGRKGNDRMLKSGDSMKPNTQAAVMQAVKDHLTTLFGNTSSKTQPAPANSGKKELCRYFQKTGKCRFGDRCKFLHGPPG